jgi:predicted ATP-grasp superfamily ATP-dependent carboligase
MNSIDSAFVIGGYTVALGIIRALRMGGIRIINLHYHDNDITLYSKDVFFSAKISHPDRNEPGFVADLIRYSEKFGHGVLFPATDEAIVAISRNRDILDKHYIVTTCEWEAAKKFVEKKYTYSLAARIGVPAPKTIIPHSMEDVLNYASDIRYPCLVKPSQSHLFVAQFGRKMILVKTREQLSDACKKAMDNDLEVMLQEVIPGNDDQVANYNAYFVAGEPVLEFTAQQIRSAPPWWGSPRVVMSKNIPELIEPGRKILKALEFEGYACVEFKKDTRDGFYKLIEVNGRHNLSSLLAVKSGLNFPLIHFKNVAEGTRPDKKEFEENIYWIDFTKDLIYSLKFWKEEKYSIKDLARPYFRKNIYANFKWGNNKPLIIRWIKLFNSVFKH